MGKILVIGALGQVGSELVTELRKRHGDDQVVASDIRKPEAMDPLFEELDILNKDQLSGVVSRHDVKTIYNLAALLSANAEKNPEFAWRLNMDGLFHVLDLAREKRVDRIFWPSSIAVFGPSTPKQQTPQMTLADPNTVYGISKLAGEQWCAYYHEKYGVDVRSIRYPGLIGYKSLPGGGTTDYAVDIFHQARKKNAYTCFLQPDARLPMMYMPDATRATLEIMEADPSNIQIRSSYNIAGMSFTPDEIATEIALHYPGFNIQYEPDFRQAIAESWPQSIDDRMAREHWGWKAEFNISSLVTDMVKHIK